MRRQFHFLGEHSEDGFITHDRDEVRTTLLDLEAAIFQLGGTMTLAAVREQIAPDQYVTTGVVIAYDSFAPARERPAPSEPEAQPQES
jgi:hypothetical protein